MTLNMTSSRTCSHTPAPSSPSHANGTTQEQSSGEDEEYLIMECPSFVRDRTITRTLHEYDEGNDVGVGPGLGGSGSAAGEPDFVSWDAKTISQHLAKYLDDLCGWVPDPKVQYRRVAVNSNGKTTAGQRTSGAGSKINSRTELEAQVRRLSVATTSSRATSRMKTMTMEFEFRHYHNPKKYMEQYRRFHTCGGPLEKLATQDASYGRKRSIYYAGNASAEAGFVKPEPAKHTESRLAAVASQHHHQQAQVQLTDRSDVNQRSPSRLRRDSETKSESPSRIDPGAAASASGAASRTTSAIQTSSSPSSANVDQTTTTALPRYCTLTEAAMRKRQTFAPWSHIPQNTAKEIAHRNGGTAAAFSEHLPPTSIPSSLSVVDKDAAASGHHVVKTQSWNPAGLRPTTTAPTTNNGFRPSLHHHSSASSSTALTSNAGDDPYNVIRPAGPPVGQHPFWKPSNGSTQSPSATSDNPLPAALGTSMYQNHSTGPSYDGGSGYRSDSAMTSSEGSAFRDFYSHLLQAAHYLRLAGRQRKNDNVNASKAHSAMARPAMYNKSSRASPGDDASFISGVFADPIPASVSSVGHRLGIRGQRLNSATHTSASGLTRAIHSAVPTMEAGLPGGGDNGGTQRKFISASAVKARFNTSTLPGGTTQQDTSPYADQTSNQAFQRKKYISLESPQSSFSKDLSAATTTAHASAPRRGSSEMNMAGGDAGAKGKVYQISIPNKPCATDASLISKAALCQAVCIQSDSKEAILLGDQSSPRR